MKLFLSLVMVSAATLSGGALAQTPAATPTTTSAAHAVATSHVRVAKTTTTRTTTGGTPAAKGRMVTTKLANGKTVTYNCSLAGNAAKKACK